MHRALLTLGILALVAAACAAPAARALQSAPTATSYWDFLWRLETASQTPTLSTGFTAIIIETATPTATTGPTPAGVLPPVLAETPNPTATVQAASLRATVTVGLLSCRYGPGPAYLYLYALRQGANITLIGRTDSDNWHWAWVDGPNPCWVNTSYLKMEGDWRQLPIVYPGAARLPVSPYYPATVIVGVFRSGNSITVEWAPILLRAGDEEDEFMQHYILEVWRCRGGDFVFEPLSTNDTSLTFIDEAGCPSPSRARLFVQEKHGFSGPTEVAWPPLK